MKSGRDFEQLAPAKAAGVPLDETDPGKLSDQGIERDGNAAAQAEFGRTKSAADNAQKSAASHTQDRKLQPNSTGGATDLNSRGQAL